MADDYMRSLQLFMRMTLYGFLLVLMIGPFSVVVF